MFAPELLRPLAAPRVSPRRQLQRAPSHTRWQLQLSYRLRPGLHLIEQTLVDGPVALQPEIAHLPHAGLRRGGGVEGKQPGLPAGLHHDAVIDGWAALLPWGRLRHPGSGRLRPATPVEMLEGQRAPVEPV